MPPEARSSHKIVVTSGHPSWPTGDRARHSMYKKTSEPKILIVLKLATLFQKINDFRKTVTM